jgi:drug/metabolite transporter (DMT)-like permease
MIHRTAIWLSYQPRLSAQWRGYAALSIAILAGSWAVILIRLSQQEHVPSPVIAAFRLTGAALLVMPFVLKNHRSDIRQMSRKTFFLCAMAGFWLAIHFILVNTSLEFTSVLISSVLFGTSPLWIALLEVVFLKVHLKRLVWAGLFVVFAGGTVIALSGKSAAHPGGTPLLGAAFAAVGALFHAFYSTLGRKLRPEVSVIPYIGLVFTCASITSLVYVLFAHLPVVGFSLTAYFWLTALTVVPQLVGHGAWNYALGHLSATYISVVGQVSIVISVVLAFIIFQEAPVALQLLGSLAVIGGVTLVNLAQARS